MKQNLTIFTLLFFALLSNAQQKPTRAPLNPDFIEYFKNAQNSNQKSVNEKNDNGMIPLPFSFGEVVVDPEEVRLKSLNSGFPENFDLRNVNGKSYISSVKDQGGGRSGGNCWAFATMGCIESSWALMGITDSSIDLSEQNLAACHDFKWPYGTGGNSSMALSYLTALKGPYADTSDIYNTSIHSCKKIKYKPIAYVPEVKWIFQNPKYIKQTLMNYGGVTCDIYWSEDYQSTYFNMNDFTSLYTGRLPVAHQIMLVGWDDNKIVRGIKGAWIAKNSWTSGWADKGFFYISYLDSKILKPSAFFPKRWETSEIDSIYFYDELGPISSLGYRSNTAYSLSKFTIDSTQYIKKVGTFAMVSGTTFDFEILNESRDSVLASLKNQVCKLPGFYTFDLPVNTKGTVYVKVKYYTPQYLFPIPVETELNVSGEPWALPRLEKKGKQMISSDGIKWDSLGVESTADYHADLSVRIYTKKDTKGIKANFSHSKEDVCIGNSVTFTNTSIGDIKNISWDFGEGALPAKTINTKGPHTITYPSGSEIGIRRVKLIVTDSLNNSDSIVKEILVLDRIQYQLTTSTSKVRKGDTVMLMAVTDADTYSWSSELQLLNNNNSFVNVKTSNTGKYKVYVSMAQGACVVSDSVTLNVLEPPVNDNMCNAIQLKIGKNGPFNNINATTQTKEPAPEPINCYTSKTWCEEGNGLDNSVWFKFTAPPSGRLSIITDSFDTQIAVYKPVSCASISIKDLIVANDDYYNKAPYSAIIDNAQLVAGAEYFLQVDGSGGGKEGYFHISFTDGAVSVSIEEFTKELIIAPNPSKGEFNLIYNANKNEEVSIEIFDLSAQRVYSNNFIKTTGNSPICVNPSLKKGIYILKLSSEKGTVNKKIVVE